MRSWPSRDLGGGKAAFHPGTLSRQNLGSRFTSSPKRRRSFPAALAAAPSAIVAIVELQVLRRERMPVAAGSRDTARRPMCIPEQLKGICEAHDTS
jgi:hypothetical protein